MVQMGMIAEAATAETGRQGECAVAAPCRDQHNMEIATTDISMHKQDYTEQRGRRKISWSVKQADRKEEAVVPSINAEIQ